MASSAEAQPQGVGPTTTTPRLDALCLLDAYASSHNAASADLKAAFWNLSRARRSRGGFHLAAGGNVGLNALDVREEIRAKAVLKCSRFEDDDVPVLESEGEHGGGKKDDASGGDVDVFVLYPEGIPRTEETAGRREDGGVTGEGTGLRQRKNAPKEKKKDENSEWTEETHAVDEEEERLKSSDPIDLFGGLPPPALKEAQAEARRALEAYVEAANLAAEILRMTTDTKSTK